MCPPCGRLRCWGSLACVKSGACVCGVWYACLPCLRVPSVFFCQWCTWYVSFVLGRWLIHVCLSVCAGVNACGCVRLCLCALLPTRRVLCVCRYDGRFLFVDACLLVIVLCLVRCCQLVCCVFVGMMVDLYSSMLVYASVCLSMRARMSIHWVPRVESTQNIITRDLKSVHIGMTRL